MYGRSRIKPGKYGDFEVVDPARTIAFILNVRPPNGCEGRVLSEAMNEKPPSWRSPRTSTYPAALAVLISRERFSR
jgi:hypothetical protein